MRVKTVTYTNRGGKDEIKWFLKRDIFLSIICISQPHYI